MATAAHPWQASSVRSSGWGIGLLPSLTDFAFVLPLFLLFAVLPGTSVLFSDGDTGWHIRTGEWIWQHKAVPTTDLFSFTKPNEAWFAWEWGWDLIFAAVHSTWGLAGVAFVNVLLLGLISALLFRLIRCCSGNDLIAFAFTLLAICTSIIHWLARPHLVSWLFVLVFLHVIVSAENGDLKKLRWLPLLMVAWTNLHGGFFVGIVLLLTSALGEGIGAVLGDGNARREAYRKSRAFLVAALACLAVTFVNPYTWHLHAHVVAYLRDSKLLDNIAEFQSISFHHSAAMFFECTLLLGGGAAFWCLRYGRITAALSILLWAHLALVSQRNIPLFAIIASPWVACWLVTDLRRLSRIPRLTKVSASLSEICAELGPLERMKRSHLTSLLAILVVAGSFAAGRRGFEGEFNPKNFPVTAIPTIQTAKFSHLFTADQWADYLIYRFYPVQRVFMDGRSDFYGDEFMTTYQHVMSAQYDWESFFKRFHVDGVAVKPDAPLATVLKASPHWRTLFDDGAVIVFRADSLVQPSSGAKQCTDLPRLARGTGLRSVLKLPSDRL